MASERIMKKLEKGKLYQIETRYELLMGTLYYADVKNLIAEFENVCDLNTGLKFESNQILSYYNMLSIKLMNEKSSENESETNTKIKECHTDEPSSSKNEPHSVDSKAETVEELNGQLSAQDFQLINMQLESVTYIVQLDQKYHKAIADIKSQAVVGLLIDPLLASRHRHTSLLAISTSKNVYIFDMQYLGKIFPEMRKLFESQTPRKAVHCSHIIVDHFKHYHDVEVEGVFDTFVAYCVVTKDKSKKSLEETVKSIFNIPDLYFELKLENKLSNNPYRRPLSPNYQRIIAKKVVFQLKLYDYLLHEQMLKKFYRQCYRFSQTFSEIDDSYEICVQISRDSPAGHEYIEPSGDWKDKLETDNF